ncbi:hypothetical protein NIIDMKKI_42440 [Mycobacterium kansasii]|uniref:Uncharacterized protein n=1 Tax=Mycobacterium kansasii TaxID=1768 RepID=A0A7G1IK62_MYCKA|nr:hypothetical protein NIIDMKKI_42440 [Mycobacterium kansasii]
MPGLIHDHCSAFHPLGVGSPFWQEIDLQRYGLTWKWPQTDCAHPLDDGSAGVLFQSIEKTAARMGPDASRWRRAVGIWRPDSMIWQAICSGRSSTCPDTRSVLPPLVRVRRCRRP